MTTYTKSLSNCITLLISHMLLQEYVAAVSTDQVTAAEKSAQLMSATGEAPAGVGSEYVIEPPSTLAAEESDDGSDAEDDEDMPLDSQVWLMYFAS